MTHVHTLKDLEEELSFIKDKTLLVSCRDVAKGKQLTFRKDDDITKQAIDLIFIYEDGFNDYNGESI